MRMKGINGEQYFMLLIDDYTRMTGVCFLKKNSKAFKCFRIFKEMVENETNLKIKCLRSDNGGEFTSKVFMEFCEERGIKRKLIAIRTPQQNGVVERKNGTVQKMVRTMLKESNLGDIFWVTALKPRWHDLLAIIKQFVTYEGRYGLVFLYHLRLLMNFIDYPLNMPHYLLRSLYNMSKRFKREKVDSSLFHHCLIKVLIIHHLSLSCDSWQAFLSRNGLATPECVQVDKVVVTETLVGPAVPPPTLLPPVKPSNCPDLDLPDTMHDLCAKDKTKTTKKPVRKKGKGDTGVNSKGKKNA
jgi:hypothetical protein